MIRSQTWLQKCARVSLFLTFALIAFSGLVFYLGHQWQPSSYTEAFSKIYSESIYQDLMDDMDKESDIILIGSNSDALDNFLKTYLTKCKEDEAIKLRDPSIRDNLELTTNKYVARIYDWAAGFLPSSNDQDHSLWVIDARSFNDTANFSKPLLVLRKRNSEDRFLVVMSSNTGGLKGFRKFKYMKPEKDEIVSLIKEENPSIKDIHIDYLFWYYGEQLDEIAKVIDAGKTDSFYDWFYLETSEYNTIKEEHKDLLEEVCKNGEADSKEIKNLRLSWIITYKEGTYYWNSPEGLLVYSGNTETPCKPPSEYVSMTDEERRIMEEIVNEEQRLKEEKKALENEREKQQEEEKEGEETDAEQTIPKQPFPSKKIKKNKQKDEPNTRKTKNSKGSKAKQSEVEDSKDEAEEEKSNKKDSHKNNKASKRLEERRSKKSIDSEESEDVDREERSDKDQDQVDQLNQYANEDDDDEASEEVVERRVRMAQKTTRKQREEDLEELEDKLKKIRNTKGLEKTKKIYKMKE